jgi:hypothetical protein
MTQSKICKICLSTSDPFSSALILSKYQVSYFRCEKCGFVQTEDPYWLDEAYSDEANIYDIGYVNRAIANSQLCERYILQYFDCNSKFVDYGAGYGIMVRRMRDLGYDFYWYDKYCQNLFSRSFEANMSGEIVYELLTAFEVFEHLINPLQELEMMLEISDNILFTTELIPPGNPKPGQWWYYFPLHGQHIAFYTQKSLNVIAESHHLFLKSIGSVHLLTKQRPRELHLVTKLAMNIYGKERLLRHKLFKKSLLAEDFTRLSGVKFN